MSERHDKPPTGGAQSGGQDWEDALRAGQMADGGKGSVEPELAILGLLRHARGPQPLGDDALEQIWSELGPELAGPVPWWRKVLDWKIAPVAALAAAAVVVVVAWPTGTPSTTQVNEVATTTSPSRTKTADVLRRQFELSSPPARERLAQRVHDGRRAMRGSLLAHATDEGKTMGGAP